MRQTFVDDPLSAGRLSFLAMAFDAVLFSQWWGCDVADITTPVWNHQSRLWHGDDDRVIPPPCGEQMAELMARSRLSAVSGQVYLAMLTAAGDAFELILDARDGTMVRSDATAPKPATPTTWPGPAPLAPDTCHGCRRPTRTCWDRGGQLDPHRRASAALHGSADRRGHIPQLFRSAAGLARVPEIASAGPDGEWTAGDRGGGLGLRSDLTGMA